MLPLEWSSQNSNLVSPANDLKGSWKTVSSVQNYYDRTVLYIFSRFYAMLEKINEFYLFFWHEILTKCFGIIREGKTY